MKKLDFIGLKNDSLKFVDIQRDMEPKFSIFGEICYLEELSAGYQSVLSLIFKIVDWIESTKKNDERLIVNANGTILIDELDVHLHPEWQLEIRNTLLTLFPKLQFIVTTHSPHIIASADVNEVIIMPKHQKTINIEPSPFCYKGWRTDDILRDLMSVGNLNSRKYYNLVKKANNFYAQNNKPSFMKCIEEIEKIAHPSDSIITVLKIKLAEMSLEEKSDDCAKAK